MENKRQTFSTDFKRKVVLLALRCLHMQLCENFFDNVMC